MSSSLWIDVMQPSSADLDRATLSRREMIHSLGGGLGGLALASLLCDPSSSAAASAPAPHFAPKARRVIQLFMNGGPFGPDFFDPKPAINRFAGQRPDAVNLR